MSVNSAIEYYNESAGEFEPYITDSSIVSNELKNQLQTVQDEFTLLEETVLGLKAYKEA